MARALFPDHLGGPRTPAGARELLAKQIERWERDGFGLWWWRERSTEALVARGGLQRTVVAGREEVEIGWAVAPERWGEGIATELALASIEVAFTQLGLENVVSFTLTANRASQRVMEKAGLSFERRIQHAGLPHVLYRLRADRRASLD